MKWILILIALLYAIPCFPASQRISGLNCQKNTFQQSLQISSDPSRRDYRLRLIHPRQRVDLLCVFGEPKELTTLPDSIDPNFTNRRSARFSGIPVADLVKALGVQEENLMILTKDNYFFQDKLKTIIDNGGLIARYSSEKDIPVRFGGPLKLVYQNRMNISAYPWYIRTIVFGEVFSQDLVLLPKNGIARKRSKEELLKLATRHKVGIPLNRGYFPSVEIQKHPQLNVVELHRLLPNKESEPVRNISFVSFGGHIRTVPMSRAHDLHLAIYDLETVYFPITGGQYLTIGINNQTIHPFVYYLEGIYFE